ncbi:ECF RNA polymerase sigma factor SigK [Jiangella alkaliphila]|uniref:RNA polymerase sigma-70 factor, ECF subfamily n=1 Tax=Jiangella alkaliphila TaxID=419479 RepID=A0A1H2LFF9_9ACTN|nr:ECF RNA polymerase sigma factor SigK [Jiangella alkaliphila]SDU79572.1 RNA polymerase sigma-70 factor, ECF subfamily [Jiangella alkaliphila]
MTEFRSTPARGTPRRTDDGLGGLLRRSAAGDEEAFEELYERTAPAIYGVAHKVLRNHAHAEEVTHDVMLEIWRSSNRYRTDRGSAFSWVLTIAHRRAVDRVRQEQSATRRDLRDAELDSRRAYDDVVETTEAHHELEQLQLCLGRLTPVQRECVRLAFYHGYTYRDVARMLDTPLGTVKTRLRDGLLRLRACMEGR